MSAVLSDDGRYRYVLRREAAPLTGNGLLTFVMLNPSTADAERDDPTVRRCVGFARSLGFRDLSIVNLFAWRATDPALLARLAPRELVGPENDEHIAHETSLARAVVAAWGAPPFDVSERVAEVRTLMGGRTFYVLGLTRDGHPRHPLYLPAGAQLRGEPNPPPPPHSMRFAF